MVVLRAARLVEKIAWHGLAAGTASCARQHQPVHAWARSEEDIMAWMGGWMGGHGLPSRALGRSLGDGNVMPGP